MKKRDAREEIRAPADVVVHEAVRRLLRPEILYGVGPEDVTHKSLRRRLAEAIKLEKYIRMR